MSAESDGPVLGPLEETARGVASVIGAVLDEWNEDHPHAPKAGFALLMFTFGKPEDPHQWLTYVSNAERGDMVKALEEFIWKNVKKHSVTEEYMEGVLTELRQTYEDIGGCDHSVGICACSLRHLIESTEDILNAHK